MTAVGADDRVRFCGQCQKNVYNVAAMAPEEALDLVDRMEGGLCVRLSRRPDGTLVTGDCRARLRYARRRGRVAFICALVAVFGVQLWTQAFGLKLLLNLWWAPVGSQRHYAGAITAPTKPTPAAEPERPIAPAYDVMMGAPPPPQRILAGRVSASRPNKSHRK